MYVIFIQLYTGSFSIHYYILKHHKETFRRSLHAWSEPKRLTAGRLTVHASTPEYDNIIIAPEKDPQRSRILTHREMVTHLMSFTNSQFTGSLSRLV